MINSPQSEQIQNCINSETDQFELSQTQNQVVIDGNVKVEGGDFVGRDKIIRNDHIEYVVFVHHNSFLSIVIDKDIKTRYINLIDQVCNLIQVIMCIYLVVERD